VADRDDWQVGDLALCVAGGIASKVGAVYAVIDFLPGDGATCHRCGDKNWGTDTLLLVGITPAGTCKGGSASRFRKIKPLSDEEQMLARAEFKADRIINAPVSA